MIVTELIGAPLPPLAEEPGSPECGSELVFHGRVRGRERDEPILGLFYEHYEGMAESELRILAEETAETFGLQSLLCLHRVGEVPVGEASVRVVLRSKHRVESLQALAFFIRELKRRVPIWKWGIRADGSRFPSPHCEGCEAAESPLHHHDHHDH